MLISPLLIVPTIVPVNVVSLLEAAEVNVIVPFWKIITVPIFIAADIADTVNVVSVLILLCVVVILIFTELTIWIKSFIDKSSKVFAPLDSLVIVWFEVEITYWPLNLVLLNVIFVFNKDRFINKQ